MKILLIAYYYPPLNTGGTVRPMKMAKYLPHFGHQVTVLTHTYGKTCLDDNGVLRIKDISHNKNRGGIRKLQWFLLRLITEILNKTGTYHSIYHWWKQAVLKRSQQIIEQVKPDILLVTYPPVETLEIGLELSKKFGIPLVADFRDGLCFEPIETKRMRQYRCIREEYARLEQEIAKQSAAILTIAQPISEYFQSTYHIANVHVLSNGYDPDDFSAAENLELPPGQTFDPEYFHIVFTGRFALSDKYNRVDYFFDALRAVVKEHEDAAQKIKLHLVGEYRKEEMDELRDLIDQGIIILHGFVKRELSIAFQKAADLLLIITPPDRRSATSIKIFEYLYAGKPILALTHETVLEDIIRETQSGFIVHPHKPEKIGQLLYKILADPAFYHSIKPRLDRIEQYAVRSQTGKLAGILSSLKK